MDKMSNKICALFCGKCWHEWKQTRWYVEYNQDNEYTCMLCGMVSTGITLDNPDFSPRSPDWWTLWERVTTWEQYDRFRKFVRDKLTRETINQMSWFEIYLVNNLSSNLAAYLRHAYKEGLHQELFKMECPCPPEYKGDQEINRVCPYCNGTGTIETPLAKELREINHDPRH